MWKYASECGPGFYSWHRRRHSENSMSGECERIKFPQLTIPKLMILTTNVVVAATQAPK